MNTNSYNKNYIYFRVNNTCDINICKMCKTENSYNREKVYKTG
jgi:hypothetical protein